MTTVTVEENGDGETAAPETIEALVVESVSEAAHASATAEQAIEQTEATAENVLALESEISRVEEWQSQLTGQVLTINEQTAQLMQVQAAQSEVLAGVVETLRALTERLTPAPTSSVDADGTPATVIVSDASPSEQHSPEETAPENAPEQREAAREHQKRATHWL